MVFTVLYFRAETYHDKSIRAIKYDNQEQDMQTSYYFKTGTQ